VPCIFKGTQRRQDDERQAKLDAQNTQLFDARMADVNRSNSDRQALAEAARPATANENAVTLNTGDGARVYEMPKGIDAAAHRNVGKSRTAGHAQRCTALPGRLISQSSKLSALSGHRAFSFVAEATPFKV
jgi:hypothetical protein